MTCRELNEFILDYLGGELPPAVRDHFEGHLGACHDCHEYLRQYAVAAAAGRRAFTSGDEALREEMPDDLVRAILAARRGLR